MNKTVLIIALFAGGQVTLAQRDVVDKNIRSAFEKFLARLNPEKLIKARAGRAPAQQAQPNRLGAHAAIEAFLKENVNDPSRLSIVRFGKKLVSTAGAYKWMGGWTYRDWKPMGVVQKGLWEPIGRKGVAVAVRYRATNRLGALVLDDKVFCVSGGVVFDWMELDDFHPTRPQKRSDPLTDQFLNLRNKLR